MPPSQSLNSSVGLGTFKPLFDPDLRPQKTGEGNSPAKIDNQDKPGYTTQDSTEPKLENTRKAPQNPLEDFLRKHQDNDKLMSSLPRPIMSFPSIPMSINRGAKNLPKKPKNL